MAYQYSRPGSGAAVTVTVPGAEGLEVDSGCLLFFDEFGKVTLAIAPGGWRWASKVSRPTPGDPSVGGS